MTTTTDTTYRTWSGYDGRGTNWPRLGARVRLRRYSKGNLYSGDATNVDLDVTGRVTETPREGSTYLSIEPDRKFEAELAKAKHFDPTDTESWSVYPHRITLSRGEFWQWDITHVSDAPPAPEFKTYTATVEAQHAPELRERRDLTGEEMRQGYASAPSDDYLAKVRARNATSRAIHTRNAIRDAIDLALNDAIEASEQPFVAEPGAGVEFINISTLDLEHVEVTVKVTDLVATATLRVPVR